MAIFANISVITSTITGVNFPRNLHIELLFKMCSYTILFEKPNVLKGISAPSKLKRPSFQLLCRCGQTLLESRAHFTSTYK